MRILITGATGMLGKQLCTHLCAAGHELIPVGLTPREGTITADLREEVTVIHLFDEYAPELILHLAALTNIRFCEQDKKTAHATNYGITEILTRACAKFETRLIFFSTDYVFGKYDRCWQEGDTPCPTTQYGIDKAASERLIQERLSDYAIVRTAQAYGFIGDFVSLVVQALTAHQKFGAFANLANCPTWIGDLLPMLDKLIDGGHQGIFHCVGPETLSRYQFACEIAKAFALDTASIQAVTLDFLNDIRPPVVRLNGATTYEALQVYPGAINENLPLCAAYVAGITP